MTAYKDEKNEESVEAWDDAGELDDYVEKPVRPKKVLRVNRPILLLAQMAVCGVVLVGAFVFKAIGGDWYTQAHDWFFKNYDNSIYTDGQIKLDFFDRESQTENAPESSADNQAEGQSKDAVNRVLPLEACTVTSPYGERTGDDGTSTFHKGVDLAANAGEAIYSMTDGTVIIAENSSSYGNYVVVQSEKQKYLYAHCSELCAEVNTTVRAGDTIAKAGDTGDADGVHLHLEITESDEYIDPTPILNEITA